MGILALAIPNQLLLGSECQGLRAATGSISCLGAQVQLLCRGRRELLLQSPSRPQRLRIQSQNASPARSFTQSCRLIHARKRLQAGDPFHLKLHHIEQTAAQRGKREISRWTQRDHYDSALSLGSSEHGFLTPPPNPEQPPLPCAAAPTACEPCTVGSGNRFLMNQAVRRRHGLPLFTSTARRSRKCIHQAKHFREPSQAISIPGLPPGVGTLKGTSSARAQKLELLC